MTMPTSGMAIPSKSPKAGKPQEYFSDQTVVSQAAQWHAHLHSGEASDDDRIAFEQWRTQQPEHAQTYAKMAALWERFDIVQTVPAARTVNLVLDQSLTARKKKRRKTIAAIVSLCVITGASSMMLQSGAGAYLLADYSTHTGQQRTITLDDQSRITLNTASAIDIDYSSAQRRIHLRRGEILIEVAQDHTRPFVVETDHGSARALGTQYVVRRDDNITTVSVIESTVRVCASQTPTCVDLHKGQQTTVTPNAVNAINHVDPHTAAAWNRHNLVVDDQPLPQVLQELSRYRQGFITFDAAQIAHLRVSGVFPLADTDRALAVLAATTPIRVRQYTPLLVVVDTP